MVLDLVIFAVKPVGPVEPVAPMFPVNPVGPVAPVAPIEPVGPVAPVAPIAPVGPVEPVAPIAPVGPVEPIAPVGPVDPCTPVAPVAPIGPVAPCGPVGPVAPIAGRFSVCTPDTELGTVKTTEPFSPKILTLPFTCNLLVPSSVAVPIKTLPAVSANLISPSSKTSIEGIPEISLTENIEPVKLSEMEKS